MLIRQKQILFAGFKLWLEATENQRPFLFNQKDPIKLNYNLYLISTICLFFKLKLLVLLEGVLVVFRKVDWMDGLSAERRFCEAYGYIFDEHF